MIQVSCSKELWEFPIGCRLNKVELWRMTGVSSATITELVKYEMVNMRALIMIWNALNCDTSNFMEMKKMLMSKKALWFSSEEFDMPTMKGNGKEKVVNHHLEAAVCELMHTSFLSMKGLQEADNGTASFLKL